VVDARDPRHVLDVVDQRLERGTGDAGGELAPHREPGPGPPRRIVLVLLVHLGERLDLLRPGREAGLERSVPGSRKS